MKIIVHAKNIDLSPSIETLVEQKLATIAKLFDVQDDQLAEARVEVGKPSKHHRKGFVYYAEVNLKIGGRLFRAAAEHVDLRIALDFARDELEKQFKKEKRKRRELARMPREV